VNDVKLGALITDAQSRDAIHIAVAPATAAEQLQPGQHVGFVVAGSTEFVGSDAEPYVGIVDPFLMAPVEEGQRFWLCLYPQTVTGIRHHWSHPAFADESGAEPLSNASAPSGPSWQTSTVLALARQMRTSGDYSALPILADALQDAGFDTTEKGPATLTECRKPDRSVTFGQRVVGLVLKGEIEDAIYWLDDFAKSLDMTYEELMTATEEFVYADRVHTLGFDTPDRVWADREQFWKCYELVTAWNAEEKKETMFFRCAC
jgi:hypothetical protein